MTVRVILIVAALFGLPSSGLADVFLGDSIYVSGDAGPSFWGSGAPFVPGSDNGMLHVVGGTSLYADSASGPAFTITVTSGAASDGLSGFVTIDYTAFFPGDFIFHQALIGLKEDGSLLSAAVAQGPGTVMILGDSNFLHYSASGSALAASPVVTITWTQIPAPASLMPLTLAGLSGRRRRS